MNEMNCYLNAHPGIHNVALLLNDKCGYTEIKDFLCNITPAKLTVATFWSYEKVESIKNELERDSYLNVFHMPEEIEFTDIPKFSGLDGDWALCTLDIQPEILLKMASLTPRYLLAEIQESYISAYKVWEVYRTTADFIQIKTLRCHKEPQILNWKRRKDSNIELSVVFPMYNVAKYLDQCIESVTKWKAPYVEFLFVNDGSPDNSRDVVLEWSKQDLRIKLLDKTNGGCASARQYGMERAQGRYVGFIDPDDFIDESMFRKLLQSAMNGSYDISYCGYNEFYENTQKSKRVEDTLGWPYCDGTYNPKLIWELVAHCRVAIWRCIYKTEMLRKAGLHFYTDLRRFDDLPFKIETFAAAKSVISVPEYLYYYRLARPGQDVSADDERLYVHFSIFKHLNNSIASQNNAILTDLLHVSKIQTHLWALSKIKPEFKKQYLVRAREDLMTTGNLERTYLLAKERCGKEIAERYKAVMKGDYYGTTD